LARQVHFAAFSILDLDQPEALAARLRVAAGDQVTPATLHPLAVIARYILDLPPRAILEGVFGSCPEGLIGLLARLGDSPISLDPGIYRLAWSLYADPHHEERRKLLVQTEGTVTASRIRVLADLTDLLVRRPVLDRASTPGEVRSLQEAVRLIQALVPDATDERLAQSLDALGPHNRSHISGARSLAKWTLKWLERSERAPVAGPFENDRDFRLLRACDLAEVGRRYRNCVGQYVGHVAAGRRVLLEHAREPEAIIELYCLHDGAGRTFYSVGQIRRHHNARLLPHDLDAIRTRLGQHGVLFAGASPGPCVPINGLLEIYDDDDTIGGLLNDLEVEVEGPVTEAA
jgi:hypothetical protein